MVRDKYRWLVVALIACYGFWLAPSAYFDVFSKFSSAIVANKEHVVGSPENDSVTALIVGGSNATYSLSAERLTEYSGERWFNTAIPSGGATFANMKSYLDSLARSIDNTAVSTVMLSTVEHIRNREDPQSGNQTYFTRTGIGFDGVAPGPPWLPQVSLLKRLLDSEPPKTNFVSEFGDLDFSRDGFCRNANSTRPVPSRLVEWATDRQLNDIVSNWIPYLHETFPQAKILINVPAQYYTVVPDENARATYMARLDKSIAQWVSANPEFRDVSVMTVMEEPITDGKLVCNLPHHLNDAGREIRTRDLWELISP